MIDADFIPEQISQGFYVFIIIAIYILSAPPHGVRDDPAAGQPDA